MGVCPTASGTSVKSLNLGLGVSNAGACYVK